jgi:hypothetical protein
MDRSVRDLFDEDADLHCQASCGTEAPGSYYVD